MTTNTKIKVNNNPLIDIYNIVEKVIRENVADINPVRSNLPTTKERQWIYPQYPEENLRHYPICSIILDNVDYSEFGVGRFGGYYTEPVTGTITDIKKNYMILTVTVSVFTKKKDRFEVQLPNDTNKSTISGKLINVFLTGDIAKALEANRDEFIKNGVEELYISDIDGTFEDSEVLFASNITMRFVMPNLWGKVYTSGELIKIINDGYTIKYKENVEIIGPYTIEDDENVGSDNDNAIGDNNSDEDNNDYPEP